MTAATLLAIFIVPVLFVVITRMAYGKKKLAELEANFDEEKAKNLVHTNYTCLCEYSHTELTARSLSL
jgi:hypothetical protein